MLPEPVHIVVHALLDISELEEIDRIDGSKCGVAWVRGLDTRAELWRADGGDPAVGVVDDRDLARAEQVLRDDDASEGVLSVQGRNKEAVWCKVGKLAGKQGTYATPPATRMM